MVGGEEHHITDLLGVYLLDAVNAAERARVELHLSKCQACSSELASVRHLPAYMSLLGEGDVRDLIAQAGDQPTPALHETEPFPADDSPADNDR